jgi:hypothetical protein
MQREPAHQRRIAAPPEHDRQAQLLGDPDALAVLVGPDRDDGDPACAQQRARAHPHLPEPDDYYVVAPRHGAAPTSAAQPPLDDAVDEAGRERGREQQRDQHRRRGEPACTGRARS